MGDLLEIRKRPRGSDSRWISCFTTPADHKRAHAMAKDLEEHWPDTEFGVFEGGEKLDPPNRWGNGLDP